MCVGTLDTAVKFTTPVQFSRVLADILPGFGVVVPKSVVVEARFSVFVLALVAKGAVLGRAPALAYLAVAVEAHFPRRFSLPVVQSQRSAQVVGHHALRPLGREFGGRGKTVFLEEPGSQILYAARTGTNFQLCPFVQGRLAIPHPARNPAPVAFAHAPAKYWPSIYMVTLAVIEGT